MKRAPRTCGVPGCELKHHSSGLCTIHYQRTRRNGGLVSMSERGHCSLRGCGRTRSARGLCDKHLDEVLRAELEKARRLPTAAEAAWQGNWVWEDA
jgi:hypothetical protein